MICLEIKLGMINRIVCRILGMKIVCSLPGEEEKRAKKKLLELEEWIAKCEAEQKMRVQKESAFERCYYKNLCISTDAF